MGSKHLADSQTACEKDLTMKRIRPVALPRFSYTFIFCTLIVSATGISPGTAADNDAKVTLVYEHALPNVPGKSIKGLLVEYGPGGSSPAHTHALGLVDGLDLRAEDVLGCAVMRCSAVRRGTNELLDVRPLVDRSLDAFEQV